MRVFAFLLALPLLAGCTDADWNHALSYAGLGQSEDDASPAADATASVSAPTSPVSSAPVTPNALCMGVARKDATENDFDTATQQRVATRSYQQCVAIFGTDQ